MSARWDLNPGCLHAMQIQPAAGGPVQSVPHQQNLACITYIYMDNAVRHKPLSKCKPIYLHTVNSIRLWTAVGKQLVCSACLDAQSEHFDNISTLEPTPGGGAQVPW